MMVVAFLNMVLASCTPTAMEGDQIKSTDCCGDGGGMQPPPPPPENNGG